MSYFNVDRNKNLKRNHVQSLEENENEKENSPTKLPRHNSPPATHINVPHIQESQQTLFEEKVLEYLEDMSKGMKTIIKGMHTFYICFIN